jgi:hypothetical protein
MKRTLCVFLLMLVGLFLTVSASAIEICPGDKTTIEWGVDPDADYYVVEVSENGGPLVAFAETGLLSIDYNPPVGTETLTAQVTPMNNCGGAGQPLAVTEAVIVKRDPTQVPFVRIVTSNESM